MKKVLILIAITFIFQSCDLIFNKNILEKLLTIRPPSIKNYHKPDFQNGIFITRYKSGSKKSEVNYVDGYKDGIAKDYYPDGNLKTKYNYSYDNKQGMVTKFYTNGTIKWEVNYDKNEKNGSLKRNYISGKIKSIQTYCDGIPVNDLTEYKDNGDLFTFYPEIIIEKETLKSGKNKTISLKIELSRCNKNVKFYDVNIKKWELLNSPYEILKIKNQSFVVLSYFINEKDNKPRKIDISAVYKTNFKNYKVITTSYNL
jgi:hypothetical protein